MSDEPGFGRESRSTVEACACGDIAVARTIEGRPMCNKGIFCCPFNLAEARSVAERLRDTEAQITGMMPVVLPWESALSDSTQEGT